MEFAVDNPTKSGPLGSPVERIDAARDAPGSMAGFGVFACVIPLPTRACTPRRFRC